MPADTLVSAAHLTAIEKIGVRLNDTFSAEEAINLGQLAGWNVRKGPAWTVDPQTGETIEMVGRNSVIRTNPASGRAEYLGDVGNSHHIIQNEEHIEFLNTLVDESGAHFELAGSMDGGRRVFVSMKLPGHMNVGGVDPVHNSLVALNSHDGSMAFTLMVAPVRYACSNVLNSTFKNRSHIHRIRHTSGAMKMVAQAREALDLSFKYLDAFQAEAEMMINQSLSQAKFEEIINREFGPTDDSSAAAATRAERKVEQISELFADASTQAGIRNTVWAGYNALTEWNDHFAPTRGDDRETSRAQKAILDPAFKNRARDMMMALV
jgi:phage/plasmid-like protein (TIGR03299 family)